MLRRICLFIILALIFSPLLYAQKIDFQTLEQESQTYYKNKEFDVFLRQLTSYAKTADKKEQAVIEYFTALTYLEKLAFLEEKKDWENYYVIKDDCLKRAEELIKRLVKSCPDAKIAFESQYLLRGLYEQQEEEGKTKQALEKLESMLKTYAKENDDLELVRNFAERLYKEGKREETTELFESYISRLEEINDEERAEKKLKDIADKYFEEGTYELSKNFHFKYLELIKTNKPDELVEKGLAITDKYYKRGWEKIIKNNDYPGAEKVLGMLVPLDKYIIEHGKGERKKEAYYQLALSLYHMFKFEESVETLEDFLDKYGEGKVEDKILEKLSELYCILSSTEINNTDNIDKYIEKEKVLIRRFPDSGILWQVYDSAGDLYVKKDDYKGAVENYRIALDTCPREAETFIQEKIDQYIKKLSKTEIENLPKTDTKKEKLKTTSEHDEWVKSLDIDVEKIKTQAPAGDILVMALGKKDKELFKKAAEEYEKLIKKYPDDEQFRLNLYLVYHELGEEDKSAAYLGMGAGLKNKDLLSKTEALRNKQQKANEGMIFYEIINYYSDRDPKEFKVFRDNSEKIFLEQTLKSTKDITNNLKADIFSADQQLEEWAKVTNNTMTARDSLYEIIMQLVDTFPQNQRKTHLEIIDKIVQLESRIDALNIKEKTNMQLKIKKLFEGSNTYEDINRELTQILEMNKGEKDLMNSLSPEEKTKHAIDNIDEAIKEMANLENLINNNFDEMIVDGKKMLQKNPNDPIAYLMSGSAYQLKTKFSGSEDSKLLDLSNQMFNKAIELNPGLEGAVEEFRK
ncbi:MAG: tetratricopeptide repeat protein [Candidatus Omnitrophica bacterium]|nr:tetratricopeptide repeat protein [Candidatus Omnitrophota bacterium]MBU2062957.1 tetratricopeptide repeat protein [Candidatus Omnitrophota bacterium]